MGIQVPLMIIDRSLISVITRVFYDRRVTHLRARRKRRPISELLELSENKGSNTEKFRVDPKDVRSEPEGLPDHREMK